jgi:hypothetical protein
MAGAEKRNRNPNPPRRAAPALATAGPATWLAKGAYTLDASRMVNRDGPGVVKGGLSEKGAPLLRFFDTFKRALSPEKAR